jgi:phage shock protein A
MVSLFSKVRTITLSSMHGVLDKAIDMNSIGAVEQHIRDLEDARKDLEGTLAESRFDLKTKQNNLTTHRASATSLGTNIRTLLASNGGAPAPQQTASAKTLAANLATMRALVATEEQQIADAQSVVNRMTQAVAQVNVKETEMKTQLGTLRGQVAASKAKSKAAGALDAVGSAVEAGGSIDGLTEKIGRENARSDAAFERALGSMPTAEHSAEADAILAEFTPKQ